jgi:predicted MFS family arabinose efflux permease
MLAAVLLTLINYHWLFSGTVVGFLVSAALVLSVTLPVSPAAARTGGIYDKTTRGMRIYLATPRLRGLLALNMAAAAGGAMVIVNTVVFVKGRLGLGDGQVAIALACFGGGSMLSALALPRLLEKLPDRRVMFSAAIFLGCVLVIAAALLFVVLGIDVTTSTTVASVGLWPGLLATWLLLGVGYSAVQTPAGRLLRRSAHAEDRPAVFAAQFALSHACWLITYPLAGWLGAALTIFLTFSVFALLTLASVVVAANVWPSDKTGDLAHRHDDLPADHAHLASAERGRHAHAFIIDDLHRAWPERTG